MPIYKVKTGQNLFDVALSLYGSIEGVYDLMISNDKLSMDTDLKIGQELEYHDEFIINSDIPEYFANNKITPSNGQRHVYFKETSAELRCIIDLNPNERYTVLDISGDGSMIVDWGDNSDLECVRLLNTLDKHTHYFDNTVLNRQIRLYGDFNIKEWDATEMRGDIMPITPMIVNEFKSYSNHTSLTGLLLFRDTYLVDLKKSYIDSLQPIRDMDLQKLDLSDCKFSYNNCIDDYLIYIAKNYHTRRACLVDMSDNPSGDYIEPQKDVNGNYVIDTGMGAVWVITHEVSWNETSPWVFNIGNTTYKYTNPNIA